MSAVLARGPARELAEGYEEAVAALVTRCDIDVDAPVTIAELRSIGRRAFAYYASLVPEAAVCVSEHVVTGGGADLPVRWYRQPDSRGHTAATVYVHGGGMVSGDLDGYERIVGRYVAETGVPALAVDYRLAPENPAPAAAEDVLRALDWLTAHAAELEVDRSRIALMGDSGGGGIAAAAALIARDRGGPSIARLVLAYPMLDDRTVHPDRALDGVATWTHLQNAVAWRAVTGGRRPGDDGYVAPARATDLTGLPPVHLDTGDCDIFRDEITGFATRLARSGVDVDLRVYGGVPHAFEVLAPNLPPSRRVLEDRYTALRRI